MPLQLLEQCVIDLLAGDRHALGIVERDALSLAEERAVAPTRYRRQPLVAAIAFPHTEGIDVDSERAAVDRGDTQRDERHEPLRHCPDFAIDAPSALTARRIGGQCAMTFVVFNTSPNSSRSLANSTCRIGSPPSSSISRTRGIRITSLSVAHEPAGPRAGLLAILKGRRAGHECRAISVGPLHEAAAPGGRIMR